MHIYVTCTNKASTVQLFIAEQRCTQNRTSDIQRLVSGDDVAFIIRQVIFSLRARVFVQFSPGAPRTGRLFLFALIVINK